MSDVKVHRFTGKFMQLPRDHVNAYVVELPGAVVVVDATIAQSSARALRQMAESFDKPVHAVLLTHGHPDHYVGLVAFEDLPRYASQGCLEFAQREDVVKTPVAESLLGDDYPSRRVFPDKIIAGGTTLTFGGTEFTFHDLGPGESDADGMWTFTDADGVTHAFVGDTASLNCHCFFRDGHALDWLRLLDDLSARFDDRARLYLGHGSSPAGTEALDWQRGYIRSFLNAVARLRQRGEADPAGRPAQEQVIAAVKEYLPGDDTLFLLDYELDKSIPGYLEQVR
jgi:glyoxylase-like metal-dependent hydrolase (beta-lactamase superfamily II)